MKSKKGSFLISLGLLLIAAALCLTAYNVYDEHNARKSSEDALKLLEETLAEEASGENEESESLGENWEGYVGPNVEVPDYLLNPEMDMPIQKIGGRDYIGVLEIPSLGLQLPIISDWSYGKLKIAPCRYEGSTYTDSLIIAGHNYRSHFSKLRRLDIGEEVRFTDVDGNMFRYEVVERETLKPTAVEEMTSGEWDLTLFTCTYGGSYRMTVRCERTIA